MGTPGGVLVARNVNGTVVNGWLKRKAQYSIGMPVRREYWKR